MPDSTVTFEIPAGASATVNGPTGSTGIDNLENYVSEFTADKSLIVYQTSNSVKDVWTLNLSELTTAQKNELQTFFDTHAKGPTNAFSYVHTNGETFTSCRFLDRGLRWTRKGGAWDVTVRLLVPQRINS